MADDQKPASGFVPLKAVKQGAASPDAALAELRQIYFRTSKRTIEHDFAHAIELLKSLPDEETRSRAHVYMEGLAEMRNEWLKPKVPAPGKKRAKPGDAKNRSQPAETRGRGHPEKK